MNGNGYREDNLCCYFHPKEILLGVCPLCLNERLLILAAKQGSSRHGSSQPSSRIKPPIHLPRIFALGSLLNRLEFRHYWKSHHNPPHPDSASTSQDDSFISIKFEDNGAASWEKAAISNNKKVSIEEFSKKWNHNLDKQQQNKETMTVIEHGKPRGTLRWRKRIGHVFQLIRWKRSNKGSVCHVGSKVEGVKVRKSWIRTLTKRRTTKE